MNIKETIKILIGAVCLAVGIILIGCYTSLWTGMLGGGFIGFSYVWVWRKGG